MEPHHFTKYSVATGERIDSASTPYPNAPVLPLGSAIFSKHPKINAVCHAHGPNSMAVTATTDSILPISEPSFMFYERLNSIHCDFFFEKHYCEEIAMGLDDRIFGTLIQNHAYIMTGLSIQECYLRAYMLEQSCEIQLRAMKAGNLKIPSAEEIAYHQRSYEGYDGCPAYQGSLEWKGLLRSLYFDGLSWCKEEKKIDFQK